MNRIRALLLSLSLALLVGLASVGGQQMRTFEPIARSGPAPEGSQRVSPVVPVDAAVVEQAVENLARAWEKGDLEGALDPRLSQGQRLVDAARTAIPKDARMSVESVRNVHTQEQFLSTGSEGERQRISTVTATVGTRLQFHDPGMGTVDVPGTNELVLEVIEVLE